MSELRTDSAARAASGLLLIAVTGYGQPEDQIRAREAGFDIHLVKPLNPHTLGVEIAKWAKDRNRSAPS
jgi:CheY-like chemotaxis protein